MLCATRGCQAATALGGLGCPEWGLPVVSWVMIMVFWMTFTGCNRTSQWGCSPEVVAAFGQEEGK